MRRRLTIEHKTKLAIAATTRETPELVEQIRHFRDSMSLNELGHKFGLCRATLCRIIKNNNIKLSDKGKERADHKQRICSIGKVPWNLGIPNTEEMKRKIGLALKGEKNYRWRNPQTEEEKAKNRATYQSRGIHIVRAKLKSPEGREWLKRATAWIRSPEGKEKLSKTLTKMIADGTFQINKNYKQGWHSSPKSGMVHYRSSYELKYYKILDADPTVEIYKVEPFSISYVFNNLNLNYTPDLFIKYVDGSCKLCEIKPERMTRLDKNVAKFEAGRKYCDKMNIDFVVITESDLGL